MPYNAQIAAEQAELNKKGANLKVDGLLGPLTEAARTKFSAPANVNTETPAGDLSSLPSANAPTSNLGNFRIALRAAAEEAGKSRAADRLGQFQAAGLGGGKPGSLGNIAAINSNRVHDGRTGFEEFLPDTPEWIRQLYNAIFKADAGDVFDALVLAKKTPHQLGVVRE